MFIPSHTLGKGSAYSTQSLPLTSNPRSRRHLRSVAPSGFDYGRYLPPLRMTHYIKPFPAWIPPRLSSLSVAKDLSRSTEKHFYFFPLRSFTTVAPPSRMTAGLERSRVPSGTFLVGANPRSDKSRQRIVGGTLFREKGSPGPPSKKL